MAITAACGAAVPVAAGAGSPAAVGNAQIQGTFQMHGLITRAQDVAGERAGQSITRTWQISSLHCAASVCAEIRVDRERADGAHTVAVLVRRAPGVYVGTGAFSFGLKCLGRVVADGGRAPYTLTIQVLRRLRINGVLYATALHAIYVGGRRHDATRCPLGVAEDAARYHGGAVGGLPQPVTPAPTATAPSPPPTTTTAPALTLPTL